MSSVASADVQLVITYSKYYPVIALVVLVVFYFATIKTVFGTFFLRTAVSNYKTTSKIRDRYMELFSTRDGLMYHVSWAKSRGDIEEAKNLMRQLDKVDQEIDAMEMENKQIFGTGRAGKVSGHKLV